MHLYSTNDLPMFELYFRTFCIRNVGKNYETSIVENIREFIVKIKLLIEDQFQNIGVEYQWLLLLCIYLDHYKI